MIFIHPAVGATPAQESEALGTPSLPLQPPRTGNIHTGQAAEAEANTVCVLSPLHDQSHLFLRMLRGGCSVDLIHGEAGAQGGSIGSPKPPSRERLSGDLNLQRSWPAASRRWCSRSRAGRGLKEAWAPLPETFGPP